MKKSFLLLTTAILLSSSLAQAGGPSEELAGTIAPSLVQVRRHTPEELVDDIRNFDGRSGSFVSRHKAIKELNVDEGQKKGLMKALGYDGTRFPRQHEMVDRAGNILPGLYLKALALRNVMVKIEEKKGEIEYVQNAIRWCLENQLDKGQAEALEPRLDKAKERSHTLSPDFPTYRGYVEEAEEMYCKAYELAKEENDRLEQGTNNNNNAD